MITFLALANTYTSVEIALFKDNNVIGIETVDKHQASKLLIPLLHALLATHNTLLSDCAFIATNQGPGPFTTLRVVIASVNGISFASRIPLIGIDGLDALLNEYTDPTFPNTVTLLNAFNRDVYFGIQVNGDRTYLKGYAPIDQILQKLSQQHTTSSTIRFIGNAIPMYTQEIQTTFGDRAHLPSPLPHACSITQIGLMGLQRWHAQESIAYQLLPLYLKQYSAPLNLRT